MKKLVCIIIFFLILVLPGCTIKTVNELNTASSFGNNVGIISSYYEYPNLLYGTGEPKYGNSNYKEGSWRAASNGDGIRELVTLENPPIKSLKKGFHITGNTDCKAFTDVAIDHVPLEFGKTYILSCYAKGMGQIHLQHGKDPFPREIYDVNDNWEKYSYVFTIGDGDGSTIEAPDTYIYIGANMGIESDLIICGIKLEQVHPSEWSPNPEEIQS